MRRREFITLVGSAAAWPLAVRAQQPSDRMRRVGVLMNIAEDDPQAQGRMAAFLQGLQPLGWIVGRNLQIDSFLQANPLWIAHFVAPGVAQNKNGSRADSWYGEIGHRHRPCRSCRAGGKSRPATGNRRVGALAREGFLN
jgi:hypothetical protein